MCLSVIWSDEQMNEWLEGQGEVIEVWKAVEIEKERYRPIYDYGCHRYCFPHSKAERELEGTKNFKYWTGYHFYTNEKSAENLAIHEQDLDRQVQTIYIKCLIKKEWITAIGKDGWEWKGVVSITLIASQAIFPHYPETEARMEDIEPFLEKENEQIQPTHKSAPAVARL